ncbi:IS66 family insertion sequence element accessory protein TnpB [Chelativorans alearense]|uniref:IS66 family insertion sequence element accessory protein TnpB n=1 Tax=Chelativorans alearense TaxID=2681495 RepID=UPI0013D77CB0|nr:IS66 family insertion sequence element accessory protein TnpB [Chelativorans alearense]
MTRSLSADLRGRVIAAIEDGISTREAARSFWIGISTAGSWYRRYRETGETQARKQGQPSRSKLDAHEAFILGLIEEVPDITLAEIGECLAAEQNVQAAPSTVWLFLDRRGITFKKRRRTPTSSSAPTSEGTPICVLFPPGTSVQTAGFFAQSDRMRHDGIGMSLYAKRLEKGRFIWPQAKDGTVSLTSAQFACLLDGIDWRNPQYSWRPARAG